MQGIFVSNDDRTTLRVHPQIAKQIGLSESMMLLQIDFLIHISNTKQHENKDWTYQSVRNLQEEYFPFWSIAKINRIIHNLLDAEYIFVGNFNQHSYDKTRWFAVNYEKVSQLQGAKIGETQTHTKRGVCQNDTPSTQNDTTIPETPPRPLSINSEKLMPDPPVNQRKQMIDELYDGAKHELYQGLLFMYGSHKPFSDAYEGKGYNPPKKPSKAQIVILQAMVAEFGSDIYKAIEESLAWYRTKWLQRITEKGGKITNPPGMKMLYDYFKVRIESSQQKVKVKKHKRDNLAKNGEHVYTDEDDDLNRQTPKHHDFSDEWTPG